MAANRYIASRDFTSADAGIHASSRLINRKFDLDRNYRNTAEILRAARTFSVPGSGMQGVLALPLEPDTAIRSGPEPWLIRLDDTASEMHCAAALGCAPAWRSAGRSARHERTRNPLVRLCTTEHSKDVTKQWGGHREKPWAPAKPVAQ
jgi:hypothetical protein